MLGSRRKKDDPEKFDFTTHWYLNENKIADLLIPTNFQGAAKTRSIAEVGGLVLNEPGILEIRLLLKRKQLAKWKINVNAIGQPKIASPSTEAGSTSTALKPKRK